MKTIKISFLITIFMISLLLVFSCAKKDFVTSGENYRKDAGNQNITKSESPAQTKDIAMREAFADLEAEESRTVKEKSGEGTVDDTVSNNATNKTRDTTGKLLVTTEPEKVLKANKVKRLLIYTGNMSIEVENIDNVQSEIKKYIDEVSGYVISMNANQMIVRVPAEVFYDSVEKVAGFGKLFSKDIQSEDVTKQFSDLSIKLENAIATKDRFIDVLKKAYKIEDILQVEKELQRITEEIEMLKGQLKYLSENISYSKIIINYSLSQDVLASKDVKSSSEYLLPFAWVSTIGIDKIISFKNY